LDRSAQLAAAEMGRLRPDAFHEFVHVLELAQGRPVTVAPPPTRPRRQPDREGLRKILVRVLLRVGTAVLMADDVPHKLAAEGIGPERIAVRPGEWAEHVRPFRVAI